MNGLRQMGEDDVFCEIWCYFTLSKPQLNHNSTQPNITLVGLYTKMTLHPPHPQQKLHISNSSAVTDLILRKL